MKKVPDARSFTLTPSRSNRSNSSEFLYAILRCRADVPAILRSGSVIVCSLCAWDPKWTKDRQSLKHDMPLWCCREIGGNGHKGSSCECFMMMNSCNKDLPHPFLMTCQTSRGIRLGRCIKQGRQVTHIHDMHDEGSS